MMDGRDIIDVAGNLSSFDGLGVPMVSAGTKDQRGMQEGDTRDYKSMTSRGLTILTKWNLHIVGRAAVTTDMSHTAP